MYLLDYQKSTGEVTVYGKSIGSFNNPEVQALLKRTSESEYSPELKSYIENWYTEYDRCPICSSQNFHWHRAVNEEVSVGFCKECNTDIVKHSERIEDLRTGKCGVLIEHNRLWYTVKEKIELSYSGGQG